MQTKGLLLLDVGLKSACMQVSHLVISLSSMTLAFAFIFGNSLRTLYESVVFLFVVRPYKVGVLHTASCLQCMRCAAESVHACARPNSHVQR
jgi:hypothetical protein